jgi:hypothetical protein
MAQVSIFLTLGLLAAQRAPAFGPEGHWLAGAVAEHYLCAGARREIDLLLDGETLGRAGRWPDWIRSRREWSHTRPWHYINVDDRAVVESVAENSTQHVLWAIERFNGQLADATLSPAERATALRFLAHFVVDVHQPLHVGRAEDRGGNSIQVRAGGRRTNLHAVWDAQSLLKADQGDQPGEQLRALIARTEGRVEALQADPPMGWARESKALRPSVYGYRVRAGSDEIELEAAYLENALDTVNLRLSEAGVRLAGLINARYCGPSGSP